MMLGKADDTTRTARPARGRPVLASPHAVGAAILASTLSVYELALATSPTSQPAVTQASPEGNPSGPQLDLRAGFVGLFRARSLALEHIVKPWAGIDVLWPLTGCLAIGPAARGTLTTDDNYGVWSIQGRAACELLNRGSWSLTGTVGLGVGHNAPILHQDLSAEAPVIPYYSASFSSVWRISSAWSVGAALEHEQLSVLGAAVNVRWQR